MTEIQKMKMELLDKFGIVDDPKSVDFCREAYKFLAEGDTTVGIDPAHQEINPLNWETTIPTEDGIYLVYADGRIEKFTGQNEKDNVSGIGVKRGGWALTVDVKDQADGEDITLTASEDKTKGYKGYIDNYLDAVADWNGKENTKHLQDIGLNEEISLKDGWWIPSLAELYFIFMNRKAINEALEYAGFDTIDGVWYWSSTESSATYAWRLNLGSGNAYGDFAKASYTLRVRAVSAFIS